MLVLNYKYRGTSACSGLAVFAKVNCVIRILSRALIRPVLYSFELTDCTTGKLPLKLES